jgi:hypothetical protein
VIGRRGIPISVGALTAALLLLAGSALPAPAIARIAGDSAAAEDGSPRAAAWESWVSRRLLSPSQAREMLPAFVERQIEPRPLPPDLKAWTRERGSLRKQILRIAALDDLVPPAWSLNLQLRGTLERDGYRIEKLTFESYPGLAVPALLYVPDKVRGPVPGIVSISGHTPTSKAAEYVQRRNVNLVRRGCVVLSYDYLGFNERTPGGRPEGANSHEIGSFSYTRRCPATLEILDAWRAIDVLCSRPEVDRERIGFTGESGGSNSTYWIAALDPRVKLAVPVSSVSTFDYWIRKDGNWDWHQRPPGIRRIAEIGTLLALHAPNPLVIVTSKRRTDDEEFPWEEAEKSHQWARHVYGLYGAADRVKHYESVTAHGYQEDKREQLYLAVERWLRPPSPQDGRELPAQVESEEALRCGLPVDNRTFRDVYAEWLAPLPRMGSGDGPAARRRFLRERLGWPERLPRVTGTLLGSESGDGLRAELYSIETEPGIRLPAVLLRRGDAAPAAVTLVPGRDRAAVGRALERGDAVLAFDLRGTGELRSGTSGLWAPMAGPPWPELLGDSGAIWTNWSWFAGRPVAGQWALDVLQVARFCRARYRTSSISVEAESDFGWPVLLAGALEPRLLESGRIRLRRESLRDDLRARGDQALADVPGLLERLDIPDLLELWPGGHGRVMPRAGDP